MITRSLPLSERKRIALSDWFVGFGPLRENSTTRRPARRYGVARVICLAVCSLVLLLCGVTKMLHENISVKSCAKMSEI
jgi:hypothetical protein